MTLKHIFTAHPETVGETYAEHLGVACSFGSRMLMAGIACIVHGLFPFLFTRTGSRTIGTLYDEMTVNRLRKAPDGSRVSAG